jgi:hypothetical protein
MPDVAIDTDGAQRFSYVLPYEDTLKNQETIGVPCIYQAEWLVQRRDFCVPHVHRLEAADYARIAASWQQYRAGLETRSEARTAHPV